MEGDKEEKKEEKEGTRRKGMLIGSKYSRKIRNRFCRDNKAVSFGNAFITD